MNVLSLPPLKHTESHEYRQKETESEKVSINTEMQSPALKSGSAKANNEIGYSIKIATDEEYKL